MSDLLNDSELQEIKYLRRCLTSHQSEIQRALDFLDKLEQKQLTANAPAGKEKRKNLNEDRKEKYYKRITKR